MRSCVALYMAATLHVCLTQNSRKIRSILAQARHQLEFSLLPACQLLFLLCLGYHGL